MRLMWKQTKDEFANVLMGSSLDLADTSVSIFDWKRERSFLMRCAHAVPLALGDLPPENQPLRSPADRTVDCANAELSGSKLRQILIANFAGFLRAVPKCSSHTVSFFGHEITAGLNYVTGRSVRTVDNCTIEKQSSFESHIYA